MVSVFLARGLNRSAMVMGGVGAAVSLWSYRDDAVAKCETAKAFVSSWGSSQYGQLGLGAEVHSAKPVAISGLQEDSCKRVILGGDSTMVLTDEGNVYTFGRGRDGILGHGSAQNESYPRIVEDIMSHKMITGSLSPHHAAVVTEEGKLFTWGRYWDGQLGRDTPDKGNVPSQVNFTSKVIDVSCGRSHTLVLTEEGKVFAFGSGDDAALGLGSKNGSNSPKEIKNLSGIVQVSAGSGYSLFLNDKGQVFSCGNDGYGKLGHGKGAKYVKEPKMIKKLESTKIVKISAGELHAAAISDEGHVFTWGFGKEGQTGHGNTSDLSVPRQVSSLDALKIVNVECGGGHTAAVSESGDVYMWGRGSNGQLGRGDQVESVASGRTTPVLVNLFQQEGVQVKDISLGSNHSAAIVESK